MNIRNDLIYIAGNVLQMDEAVLDSNTLIAIEDIGYQFGMASAGIKDRIRDFYEKVIFPGIKKVEKQFYELQKQIADEIIELRGEGFAGPETAKIVILASTAESMMKLLPAIMGNSFDLSQVTPTYIMYWTFFYLLFQKTK